MWRGTSTPPAADAFTLDGPARFWLTGGRVDGTWATVNFGSRTEQVLAMAEREPPNQPRMCMEFWNGWFDHWGEPHHVRGAEGASGAAGELRTMLKRGMSVNFYMAHGGSNPGLLAGANTGPHGELQPTTSYDYDAPGTLVPRTAVPVHGPVESIHPPAFEDMGLERSIQVLTSRVELTRRDGDQLWPLRFHDLHDRAYVFLDGQYAGVADRNAAVPGAAAGRAVDYGGSAGGSAIPGDNSDALVGEAAVSVNPSHLIDVLLPSGEQSACGGCSPT